MHTEGHSGLVPSVVAAVEQVNRKRGLTPEEAAEALGCSRSLVYRLLGTGELHSVKLGRRRVIPSAAVDALLAGGSHAA